MDNESVSNHKEVNRRYRIGNIELTEFGLQLEGKDIKVVIRRFNFKVKIMIDDRCYDSK